MAPKKGVPSSSSAAFCSPACPFLSRRSRLPVGPLLPGRLGPRPHPVFSPCSARCSLACANGGRPSSAPAIAFALVFALVFAVGLVVELLQMQSGGSAPGCGRPGPQPAGLPARLRPVRSIGLAVGPALAPRGGQAARAGPVAALPGAHRRNAGCAPVPGPGRFRNTVRDLALGPPEPVAHQSGIVRHGERAARVRSFTTARYSGVSLFHFPVTGGATAGFASASTTRARNRSNSTAAFMTPATGSTATSSMTASTSSSGCSRAGTTWSWTWTGCGPRPGAASWTWGGSRGSACLSSSNHGR